MPCRASKARLCVSDDQEGQVPRQRRTGGPRQAEKAPRSGVWSSPERQLHLLPGQVSWDTPSLPVSINPAAASVQPQGMSTGGSISPQCHSSRHSCPPEWLGWGVGPGWPWLRVRAAGGRAGTKALGLCTAECGSRSRDTRPEQALPLGTATSSPAPGSLTTLAAAAPGSASGRSSCQIHKC